MFLHDTTEADYLALATEDDGADLSEFVDEKTRLSNALVEALQHEPSEPLANITAGEALYELQCNHTDGAQKVEALVFWAARQTGDPILRAMVREIADCWAETRIAA